jgi:hypothetical protein
MLPALDSLRPTRSSVAGLLLMIFTALEPLRWIALEMLRLPVQEQVPAGT